MIGPKDLRLLEATEVSLLVEWDFVRGAEYYVLTYHPEGEEGSIITVNVPNTENSYLITGLVPGLTYMVQVYAVIKEINSESVSLEAATGKNLRLPVCSARLLLKLRLWLLQCLNHLGLKRLSVQGINPRTDGL